MKIRRLEVTDYKGFKALCDVFGGMEIDEVSFKNIVYEHKNSNIYTFIGIAIDEIVATHTIIIEHKYIHNGGKVAHFEDLIVHPDYREHGIGAMMLANSVKFVKEQGCYKGIWSCTKENIKYYERTLKGYEHEYSMRTDFD